MIDVYRESEEVEYEALTEQQVKRVEEELRMMDGLSAVRDVLFNREKDQNLQRLHGRENDVIINQIFRR